MSLSVNYPVMRPTLNLNFARARQLDPRITFTRASTATYFDSSGVLQTAIAGQPRFDFSPTTLQSLGLLIEEQRTNLCLQSEDFSTTWTTTGYVITANAIASPSGTTTADKLARDTTNVAAQVTQNVTCVANTAYNFSCFVKAAGQSKVGLREGSVTGNYVTFDLSTATVISTSVATGTITSFPNGWYRVTMQMTTAAAQTTYGCRIIPLPDTYTSGSPLFSFAGDGTSGLYLWGAQLEAGAFPTSYIPTTASAATRNADVATMTGTNFSSWYNATEGSLYSDNFLFQATGFKMVCEGAGGGTFRDFSLQFDGTKPNFTARYQTGNFDVSGPVGANNVFYKLAASYTSSSADLAFNGTLATTKSSIAQRVPADSMFIGSRIGGSLFLNGHIRRIAYYPVRLSNDQLQALTR